jgi:hypothetical protein
MNNLAKGGTFFVAMLLAVGLSALPGRGSEFDCAVSSTCLGAPASWGSVQSPSASGTLGNGSYTESTYLNGSGVWTYYFVFTSSNNVTSVSTGLGPMGSESDNFLSSLSYGVETTKTTGGGTPTFNFNYGPLSTLSVTLGSKLLNLQTFAFYAQSMEGPAPGTFSSIDGGSYNGSAVDPAPEPATLGLMGVGLLGLGLIGLSRKKRSEA